MSGVLDPQLNLGPPTGSVSFELIADCQLCNRRTICMLFISDPPRIIRPIVCVPCGNLQLTCVRCRMVIECYAGQQIKDIRYCEDAEWLAWKEDNNPVSSPIYCKRCGDESTQ